MQFGAREPVRYFWFTLRPSWIRCRAEPGAAPRAEPPRRAQKYASRLLAGLERKNGWTRAENLKTAVGDVPTGCSVIPCRGLGQRCRPDLGDLLMRGVKSTGCSVSYSRTACIGEEAEFEVRHLPSSELADSDRNRMIAGPELISSR